MADEPSFMPLAVMNGEPVELVTPSLTTDPAPPGPDPAPQAPPGPDPDPDAQAGSMSGMVTFSPAAIRGFIERGFLTVQDPSFDDVARANFKMLTAAWKAGVRADGQASPTPPNDAEEETKRRFFEKLARIQT